MEQDLAHYDRLTQDDPNRSYDYLLRCCRRVIERNRFTWARTELSKSIASGGRALVTKEKERPRGNSKGKDKKGKVKGGKKGEAAGDHAATGRKTSVVGARINPRTQTCARLT